MFRTSSREWRVTTMTEMGGLPVSAPGAMSSRTDQQPVRNIPASYWGEGEELKAIQAAAPMAAVPPPRPADLFARTERPDEPITSGVDLGPGPGSDVLAQMPVDAYGAPGTMADKLRRMAQHDPSGDTERLLAIAERLGW